MNHRVAMLEKIFKDHLVPHLYYHHSLDSFLMGKWRLIG